MKHILLIATGGTIASKSTADGLAPAITSEELLSFVPKAREFCTVHTKQILNIDSTNIQPEHWILMTQTIKEAYDSYDGFVISHGTDTLSYTSAALSYLIQNSPKPIVLTGAQKPIDVDTTDARKNLLDSLRFACFSEAHGVCIVFDGKVIAGTRAHKVRTKSYNAFESINFPYIAVIQEERIIQYIKPCCPASAPSFYTDINPKVFLLKLIPGMWPDILPIIGEFYDAVILESYGVGGIPNQGKRSFLSEVDSLIMKGKVVVMSTQVTHEGSDMAVYEVGHRAKKAYGLMESYDMTLEAALTKLMWILGMNLKPDQIKKMFYTTIANDILFQD